MDKSLFTIGKSIYKRQLAVILFIISLSYKIVMLPKYMSIAASRDSALVMVVMMAIETVMFVLVYATITCSSILDAGFNKWFLKAMLALLLFSSSIKLVALLPETLDYISSILFEEGKWFFIIVSLLPVIGYIAYKGMNTIARLSEIIIWFVILAIAFTVLFMKVNLDFANLFPILDDGVEPLGNAIDKHFLWFGDFTPLLIVRLAKEDKTRFERAYPPLSMILVDFAVIGFFVAFIAIYGNVASYIDHAFSNIGVYNKISDMLGGVDFPIIIVWLMMSIIKLSFLLYTVTECTAGRIKEKMSDKGKLIIVTATLVIVSLILIFAIDNIDTSYEFATSDIRYFVMASEYLTPLIAFIATSVKFKKSKEKVSDNSGRKNEIAVRQNFEIAEVLKEPAFGGKNEENN